MSRCFTATLLLASLSLAPVLAGEVDLPRYPSISPDGETIVFTWRGDLWRVPATGGSAVRLTRHAMSDVRSAWSPDGNWIAFDSRRVGPLNLYRMRSDGSDLQRVTRTDRDIVLSGFGQGGETILGHCRREGDVYRASRPYLVSTEGGELRRLLDAFGHSASISPDGRRVVFVRGESSWTRRGYRGPDTRELWLYDLSTGAYRRLTHWAGNDGRPRWRDAETIVFLSDREDETANLYSLTLADPPAVRRLTTFVGTDVHSFDVARDGSRAVLVAWDRLYVLDADGLRVLTITASDDNGDDILLKPVDREAKEAALSPDGKVLATVAYGKVFVRALGDHTPTRQVTTGPSRERDVIWSPDSTRLYFVSDQDGTQSIYAATVVLTRKEVREAYGAATEAGPWWAGGLTLPGVETTPAPPPLAKPAARWHSALQFSVEPVVCSSTHDRGPRPSPDGKRLAFRRGRGDLAVLDLATGAVRVLHEGWDTNLHFRWSPDGRHIAYAVQDRSFNSDIWIAPTDGSRPPVNISMHPDGDYSPRWSADGKILAFLSSRASDQTDVWAVYLDASLEALTPQERQSYYEEAAKAASKPTEDGGTPPPALALDLDDAYLRLRRITRGPESERNLLLSRGGETLFFVAGERAEAAVYSISWEGKDRKRVHGDLELQHLSAEGGLVFVKDGRAGVLPAGGGKPAYAEPHATLRIVRREESRQKFEDAARVLAESFYHPTMKGLDWPALTQRYAALAERSCTADEFRDVASRLVGELNASHLGISPPRETAATSQESGRLGIVSRRGEAHYRVVRVLPRGPADRKPMQLRVGDRITAIEGDGFGPADTMESRLRGRVGQETLVTVRRVVRGADTELRLLITPVSYWGLMGLHYDAWQRDNARKVAEWSGGRIGYLHIRGMNQTSLEEFERDLYAAAYRKEGLLVDVRNNGGGWTADRVLASLMVRPHAYTVPRGADPAFKHGYPGGRLFIHRYSMPANMLCNQKSFSNAEILSHAFKTLGRGKLVGEQTYGGVISTGGTTLVDGTRVRIPFRGWYLPDGTDMENHGAVPDLRVEQTPEDEAAGFDRQLKVATEDLLGRLEK